MNLPEVVEIVDFDTAWKVFQWLEAIDWKWPLTTLIEQPELLMNDIAQIASLSRTVERIKEEEDKQGELSQSLE